MTIQTFARVSIFKLKYRNNVFTSGNGGGGGGQECVYYT